MAKVNKPGSDDSPLLYVPLFLTESLLPFRSKETTFTRRYGKTNITIQGGADETGQLPLASGILARRLLYYFITQAWLKNSPKVNICGTQTLLKKLGVNVNNSSRRSLKKQVYYLSLMTIRIKEYIGVDGDSFRNKNIPIMNGIEIYNWTAPEQLMLFRNHVEFSPQFFELLQRLRENHPPIDKNSMWSLTGPLQSDIYCWLQRRLQHPDTLSGKFITWENLYGQFGRGQRMADFVYRFRRALVKVIPAIKNDVLEFEYKEDPVVILDDGIRLHNVGLQVDRQVEKNRRYF
jgi:hypothetical protein